MHCPGKATHTGPRDGISVPAGPHPVEHPPTFGLADCLAAYRSAVARTLAALNYPGPLGTTLERELLKALELELLARRPVCAPHLVALRPGGGAL